MPIPDVALEQMREAADADIDFAAVAAYEKRFRHDVMAHVHAFGDAAPAAKGFIHYGATSCYVTDNAELVLMREGLALLRAKVVDALHELADFAREWRDAAHARLHAPAAGAAHHRRQARDALDAGSRARPRRARSPRRDAALSRREGDDGDAGVVPRDLRRRPRQGARARPACHRGDGVRVRRSPSAGRRTRASSTRRCSSSSPASPPAPPSSPRTCACCRPLGRSRSRSRRSRSGRRRWPTSGTRCAASGSTRSPASCRRSSRTPTRRTRCSTSSARSTTRPTAAW